MSGVAYLLLAANALSLPSGTEIAFLLPMIFVGGKKGSQQYMDFDPLARVTVARMTLARRLIFGSIVTTIAGIPLTALASAMFSGRDPQLVQLASMAFASVGVIAGVIGWAQRWQGSRNLGRDAWLHVTEIPPAVDPPAAVRWPLFLVNGLDVHVGLDTAHIRSRFETRELQSVYLKVFDAEGRRLKFRWHSPYDRQFEVVVDEQPPDPEALAAALRGALGIDPYVRPLVPLEDLVREMIRIDGPD